MMNYSILLPRRSMLFEEEPEPAVDIEQVLRKDKKSLADVRTAFDYFQSFSIPQQFRLRRTNNFKEFLQALVIHSFIEGQLVFTSSASNKLMWLVLSGEVLLKSCSGQPGTADELIVKEHGCFGYEGCGEQQCWDGYMAQTNSECTLASIEHSRLTKFISIQNVCNEAAKHNFICSTLDLDCDSGVLKSLIRKFSLRQYSKDSTIVQEGQPEDYFMLIRRGSVRLVRSLVKERQRTKKISAAIISEGAFLNDQLFFTGDSCNFKYGAESETAVELYVLPQSQLIKCFQDMPDLEQRLVKLAQIRSSVREQLVAYSLNEQLDSEEFHEERHYITSPILKKQLLSNKKSKQNNFIGPIKYQQIVDSEQKVWGPLSDFRCQKLKKNRGRVKAEDLSRILKQEKMNKLMVKQLINKRIKGIQDKDIKIELKPTLFQEKSTKALVSELAETDENSNSKTPAHGNTRPTSMYHPATQNSEGYRPLDNVDTGLINHMSKNLLDYKKNVLWLRQNDRSKHRTGQRLSCDLSSILRERLKPKVYYEYVPGPRQQFQCQLTARNQTHIFSQTKSGKHFRKKVRLS